MKKIILMTSMMLAIAVTSFAQDGRVEKKSVKVKKTSSLGQSVNNTFSKHKHHTTDTRLNVK